nr:gag pol polyprotein [Hymenolepis microstoma]
MKLVDEVDFEANGVYKSLKANNDKIFQHWLSYEMFFVRISRYYNLVEIRQVYQGSEVDKHIKASLGIFPLPNARFVHACTNIVDPLPLSNCFVYFQICVDYFYYLGDAFPTCDLAAGIIAGELDCCICNYHECKTV